MWSWYVTRLASMENVNVDMETSVIKYICHSHLVSCAKDAHLVQPCYIKWAIALFPIHPFCMDYGWYPMSTFPSFDKKLFNFGVLDANMFEDLVD
jgi:hypothetical protein